MESELTLYKVAKCSRQLIAVTHAVDAVDDWVVAAVAHGQPVAEEEDDVDVPVAEVKKKPRY